MGEEGYPVEVHGRTADRNPLARTVGTGTGTACEKAWQGRKLGLCAHSFWEALVTHEGGGIDGVHINEVGSELLDGRDLLEGLERAALPFVAVK